MAAELEEKEAIALQQRMAAALSDADFQTPAMPPVRQGDPMGIGYTICIQCCFLTLGAHMYRGSQYLVCVYVCVSVHYF